MAQGPERAGIDGRALKPLEADLRLRGLEAD